MSLRVEFVAVCDEVRREDNGKLFLIGTYGADIRVANFPSTIQLTVVVRLYADEAIAAEIEFMCDAKGSAESQIGGHLTMKQNSSLLMPVRGFLLPNIQGPTDLTVKWRLPAKRWKNLHSFPIKRKETADS